MRSLQADIAAVSDERRARLDEVRRIAARLEAVVAETAAAEDEMPPETPGTPEPPAAITTDVMPPAKPNGAEAQNHRPQAPRPGPET
jgi:hypothetical protein